MLQEWLGVFSKVVLIEVEVNRRQRSFLVDLVQGLGHENFFLGQHGLRRFGRFIDLGRHGLFLGLGRGLGHGLDFLLARDEENQRQGEDENEYNDLFHGTSFCVGALALKIDISAA